MSINIPASQWRRQTSGGIPYKLVSQTGSFSPDDSSAEEVYIIRASDVTAFITESFPSSYSFGGFIVWGNPRRMPGYPLMESKTVKFKGFTDGRPIDPFGADTGASDGTYEEFVEIAIGYGITRLEDPEGIDQDDPLTFLEISSKAASTTLALPVDGMAKWGDGTFVKEADIPKAVLEPTIEWSFRWPSVPYAFFTDILISRIRAALGKVNSGPTSLFQNAPAETILFTGYSIDQQITWQRQVGVQYPPLKVEFTFQEKGFYDASGTLVTHNHLLRPTDGKYLRLLTGTGQLPLYGQTNLDSIFARS